MPLNGDIYLFNQILIRNISYKISLSRRTVSLFLVLHSLFFWLNIFKKINMQNAWVLFHHLPDTFHLYLVAPERLRLRSN